MSGVSAVVSLLARSVPAGLYVSGTIFALGAEVKFVLTARRERRVDASG